MNAMDYEADRTTPNQVESTDDIDPTVPVEKRGLAYSIYRSLLNQYARYTLFTMSACTAGMGIASIHYGWNWQVWGLAVLQFFLIDEGMKSLDLSAPDINLEIRADVQYAVGSLLVLAGTGVSLVLAAMTTPWYAAWIGLLIFLGLAYNLEWFDGYFHDRQYVTGIGNLAFILGMGCTVSGYILLAGQISPGIVLFGVGPTVAIGTFNWEEEDMKDKLYEHHDMKHTRETPTDLDRIKCRHLKGHTYTVYAMAAMAAGLVVEVNGLPV